MDAIGWGLFFLAIGIAVAGHNIGSGIEAAGDALKDAAEELARTWDNIHERDEVD